MTVWAERAFGLLLLAVVRGVLRARGWWERWQAGRYAR